MPDRPWQDEWADEAERVVDGLGTTDPGSWSDKARTLLTLAVMKLREVRVTDLRGVRVTNAAPEDYDAARRLVFELAAREVVGRLVAAHGLETNADARRINLALLDAYGR